MSQWQNVYLSGCVKVQLDDVESDKYILSHGCRVHTDFMNEGDISRTSERSERVSEMSPE